MTAFTNDASVRDMGREAPLLFGGWEVGLLVIMACLYAAGLYLNPAFFGSTDALFSVLRDASRYGVLAIGMTFVIVNKELDLSVGSTFGLTATIFGMIFAPTYFDMGIWTAVAWCLVMGLAIGLINGFMVTVLEVPAFIATLTMLFIGRGVILGLTGGKNIAFEIKAGDYPAFFHLGEINAFGFNNQIILFVIIAVVAAAALAYTTIGWTTYSVGGNEQAARYAGINTRFVRMRSYVLSSLCAVIAGLMNVAQNKDADPLAGFGVELIAISSVIVGGAAIFGGRGRIFGSCLGAILIGLIDKVLREGIPTTRTIDLGDGETTQVAAVTQLPPGAVPACLGMILIIAVLIEPWLVRRRAIPRLWAWLRGRPPPPVPDLGGVAILGVQTRGANVQAQGLGKRGLAAFFYRRDAAAVILMVALWLFGLWARPDFWGGLDNSFAILLAFSEIALLAVGLTFVMANGDIDLSVGSVLALSGAVAAVIMKDTSWGPLAAVGGGILAGVVAGVINGWLTAYVGLPAFIATLGHVLLGARNRILDCRRHPAQRFSGIVQSHRTKPLRAPRRHGRRADWRPLARRRQGGQRADHLCPARCADCRNRARSYHLRGEGLRDRRQRTRREFRRHQYAAGAFHLFLDLIDLRRLRRNHLRRLLSQLHSDRWPVARARQHLLNHHRRRIDLRWLRNDDRLACGRGGDHAHSLALVAPDHPEGRLVLRPAAAMAERVHRPHSDRRGGRRHLAAPAQYPRPMVRPKARRRRADARRARQGGQGMSRPVVEMRSIDKSFGPVRALVDVHLTLMPGEVLGLVGDNSAGKSTLMKIMTGAYQRDTGDVLVDGEPVHFKSPHESRDLGIEMIYQDFALCGNLDVSQNIFLGRWPRRFGLFVDRPRMHRDARTILDRLKVDVNSVYQKVESLSGGRQQSVAIARAISFEPKVVIFDEPTANLSVTATNRLLETMLELKRHRVSQIIISHRLNDIFEVGDRVMVLKRGRNVGERAIADTTEKEVLELIVSGVPETIADPTLSA